VTFLDTPGHAAFTAMRARGANMTDVVVLVVAADDGVMPTTVEAINHAKAAGATVVVALNKIDLPHEIDKIYGQLTEHGLTPSGDWGGDTDVIKTSAVTGEGITELLEHLATLSEVMELQADPTLPATGTVIEAERSGVKGAVARVLVQEGSLRTGDVIVCGVGHGRVRALRDATGKALKCAGPSTPVEVTGLSEVPSAGDRFFVLDNARLAKEIAEEMAALQREAELVQLATPTSLESMLAGVSEGEIPELNVIIRADVQGSVDVLKKTLSDFPSDQVRLNVIHAGVGSVTESDVVLAQASQAVILAFHVVPEPAIVKLADDARVDIRGYRVIYNLTDDIRKALEGLLEPDEKIESRGRAEVREVFSISRVGKIAGCYVRDGVISRSHMIRILRDSVLVKDNGEIASLKRFKDDAKEVKNGFECGIRIEAFDDLKPGDIIESFEVVKIAKTLDV
jgi:translation initiation factor IF-2